MDKIDGFRWAGFNDFFSEIYLAASFAVAINTSKVSVETGADIVNNTVAFVIGVSLVIQPVIFKVLVDKKWRIDELKKEVGEACGKNDVDEDGQGK